MPSVVGVAFLVLGSIIFSVTLVIVCGKRKLSERKECSRRNHHIPGQEAKKVKLSISFLINIKII